MSFTIQNALLPVESGYETADVQVVDNCISAIAPNNPPSNSPPYQGGELEGGVIGRDRTYAIIHHLHVCGFITALNRH